MNEAKIFILELKKKIYSKIFQEHYKIGKNSFIRKRKLTFPIVFTMILKLIAKSLGIECELLELNPNCIAPSKQAFSKARYKISHKGFEELLKLSNEVHYRESKSKGCWRGYRVIAADGSSIRLPNSEEVELGFGRFKCNRSDGRHPILGRVSLFVDLCSSMIISGRLASWGIGEQTLAVEQLEEVTKFLKSLGQEKQLYIYDRGYASINFIEQHYRLGADFIFRLQRGMYKELWKRVKSGEKDFDFVLRNKKTDIGKKVRVVAITLPTNEIEVLITSLFDREVFKLLDIGKIYFLRWHIEECYKRLKVTAELENFSGTNLEAVLQEFWAHLLMCNTLSLMMCDKQGAWDPDNIPEYRLNFSVLFGVMREQLAKVIVGKYSVKKIGKLFERVAMRAKIKLRPNRNYSREMVGKPVRHHIFRRVC